MKSNNPKLWIRHEGYPFNAGQLEYDYRYSKTPGMPVTGGRGFRSLKPLWHIVSRLTWVCDTRSQG